MTWRGCWVSADIRWLVGVFLSKVERDVCYTCLLGSADLSFDVNGPCFCVFMPCTILCFGACPDVELKYPSIELKPVGELVLRGENLSINKRTCHPTRPLAIFEGFERDLLASWVGNGDMACDQTYSRSTHCPSSIVMLEKSGQNERTRLDHVKQGYDSASANYLQHSPWDQ